MFAKVLIANRGEIAVRIIRACRELGIRVVAVHSEADANALHVRLADEAVLIGPPPASESYLRGDRIIEAARAVGAQAIHPGYGFLAENADFAEAVHAAGLVFVGPPPDAIRKMGSKTRARVLMQAAGVPVVPGYHAAAAADFAEMAGTLGYPVLVKAAAGGGGRGMRVVWSAGELQTAVDGAGREAAHSFGDGSLFLEKYLERAKHIEFQVFGDAPRGGATHGNVVHLFERECSVQRRHQKIIEESPAPLLNDHPELRAQMAAAAVAAARAVGYQNAGTVEFIVDPQTLAFYFLEMNTRLQVEHPVTEAVTGLDLVHLQLRVAAGESLPFTQDQVTTRGHAIECRVCAEDPAQDFLPASGPVLVAREPHGPGLRVDSGFSSGDEVPPHYDSLMSKVIAHAPTRAEAIMRVDAALTQYRLLGLTTNLDFLRVVLAHPDFRAGAVTTRFIESQLAGWKPAVEAPPAHAFVAAAMSDFLAAQAGPARDSATTATDSPWARPDGFRIGNGR